MEWRFSLKEVRNKVVFTQERKAHQPQLQQYGNPCWRSTTKEAWKDALLHLIHMHLDVAIIFTQVLNSYFFYVFDMQVALLSCEPKRAEVEYQRKHREYDTQTYYMNKRMITQEKYIVELSLLYNSKQICSSSTSTLTLTLACQTLM